MYASKRRQRNFKRVRDPPKSITTTNPSKRHRERLNGELETVAALLPYDNATISRLDKLSVLRLAVSFLQCKAHFQACVHNTSYLSNGYPLSTHSYTYQPHIPTPFSNKVPTIYDPRIGAPMLDHDESNFEEIALRALGGFIVVINDNGEIYYTSENVEYYLGFHQSDVLHQPIYDLIHSEDRDDIRQHLDINFTVPPTTSSTGQFDVFAPQNSKYLERNVNARFRCLLDNTCGFLRIDMRGKLLSLHGLPSSYVMGRTSSGPVLGMICVCTPFVPPSGSELAAEEMILKSKHQLDGTLVSMDHKVFEMLEMSEGDLPISLYQLIHVEDAVCMAEAHKEVIKNGSSGLLVYRLVSMKSRKVYFVQSSCRLFYKNSKPESIGLTHRLLNEVEGTMLLEKRSSLKAKLLSFDDSFLQSPRNLQSTAALPLPPVVKDDDDSARSDIPSTSTQYPPQSQSRRRRKEPPVIPIPPVIQQPFEHVPMFDVSYQQHWIPPPTTDMVYQQQYSMVYQPPPAYSELTGAVDYSNWHHNDMTMQLPISGPVADNKLLPIPQMSHFIDYSLPKMHDNSNLISEVTSLLGT